MTELLIILLICGLMLVGAEVFVPGGVLGFIGGLALIGAGITAFLHPSITTAEATAINGCIVILVGVIIFLWIKFFPKTPIGKKMTVFKDLHNAKSTDDDLPQLVGHTGTTLSQLHPGGYADIDGKRVDVITQGEMIDCNTEVKVVEVEGNRIVVEQI